MNRRIPVLVVAALQTAFMVAQTGRGQALNPPYLGEMPSVERVLGEVQGKDPVDRAARQAGVLWQLRDVVRNLAYSKHRTDRQFTPDEQRVMNEYYSAYFRIWQPVQKALASDRPRLFKLEGYTVDKDLLAEALQHLSSPAFRAQYFQTLGLPDARVRAHQAAEPPRAKASAGDAAQPASAPADAHSAPIPPAPQRPTGPKNSVLQLLSELRFDRRATFVLLDDDLETILRRAGFKPQMVLGKELPLLASLEFVKRIKEIKETNPFVSLLETMGGESAIPDDVIPQYDLSMKAIAEHTVATMQTDSRGRGRFPSVPAGTYYVWGTHEEFVSTGFSGTVVGPNANLAPTGYQRATIWNLKVPLEAGLRTVTLNRDNAAFEEPAR